MAHAHAEAPHYSKYEKARMLGSRALQISMGAPFLVKLDEKELEKIKYDPLEIAKREFEAGILPITIKRPLPGTKRQQEKKAAEASPAA